VHVHLVDGTHELFRHYYALPSARDQHGCEVAAVRGVLASVFGMIRDGARNGAGCRCAQGSGGRSRHDSGARGPCLGPAAVRHNFPNHWGAHHRPTGRQSWRARNETDAGTAQIVDEVSQPKLNFPHDFIRNIGGFGYNRSTIDGIAAPANPLSPQNDQDRY
jgi:hypothetical protein